MNAQAAINGRVLYRKPALGDAGSTGLFHDVLRIASAAHRGIIANQATGIQIVQARIHQHHSVPAAGLDCILEVVQMAFPNEIANRIVYQ